MTRSPRVNEQVAPPSQARDSSTVTAAPASRSWMAALIPASPPPMTRTLPPSVTVAAHEALPGARGGASTGGSTGVAPAGGRGRAPGQRPGRDHELFLAGQRLPALQHDAGSGREVVQQPQVDAGHGARRGGAAPVQQRHQAQAAGIPAPGPVGLEPDQPLHARGVAGRGAGRPRRLDGPPRGLRRVQRAAELLQVLGGQVDPAVAEVLADVAQDVGQLQGHAQRVRQRRRRRPGRWCRTRRATGGRWRRPRSGSSAPGRRRSR